MITIRKAEERGHFDFGWLDTYHTFSFGEYFDLEHMGFGSLRVINEDKVEAGEGFPSHPHKDMEIITYILEGELQHKDSMGNGSIIKPGDIQRMSAGKGVFHSEFNPSKEKAVHLLQIWILPNKKSVNPSYEEKFFDPAEKQGKFRLVASPDGSQDSVTIHQDLKLYASLLEPNQSIEHSLQPSRKAWIQVVRGEVDINGQRLSQSDGAAISNEQAIKVTSTSPAEILLFDMA